MLIVLCGVQTTKVPVFQYELYVISSRCPVQQPPLMRVEESRAPWLAEEEQKEATGPAEAGKVQIWVCALTNQTRIDPCGTVRHEQASALIKHIRSVP